MKKITESNRSEIKKMRDLIYRHPLSMKKQQVVARVQRRGKVKIFTEPQILSYCIERSAYSLFGI